MRINKLRPPRSALLLFPLFSSLLIHSASAQADEAADAGQVPPAIAAIFDKPVYSGSIWGLRVVDLATGEVLINRKPAYQFFIGSVRKVFTIGELINQIGPAHTFDTPVYREGPISSKGVLQGDLILVASGDLTMGGRTNLNGKGAVTDYDHNEANSLGNAQLTMRKADTHTGLRGCS
jgi:D-alanyl-D-alanine carboxypeptidase